MLSFLYSSITPKFQLCFALWLRRLFAMRPFSVHLRMAVAVNLAMRMLDHVIFCLDRYN